MVSKKSCDRRIDFYNRLAGFYFANELVFDDDRPRGDIPGHNSHTFVIDRFLRNDNLIGASTMTDHLQTFRNNRVDCG